MMESIYRKMGMCECVSESRWWCVCVVGKLLLVGKTWL
jgi:hypothetical protein